MHIYIVYSGSMFLANKVELSTHRRLEKIMGNLNDQVVYLNTKIPEFFKIPCKLKKNEILKDGQCHGFQVEHNIGKALN